MNLISELLGMFDLRSLIQVSKKQNVSTMLNRRDSLFWKASVIERYHRSPGL